jgi:hypothetical protein
MAGTTRRTSITRREVLRDMALERGECVCGKKLPPGKTFCCWEHSAAYSTARGHGFAEATTRPAGKPKDGVTYAASKREKKS